MSRINAINVALVLAAAALGLLSIALNANPVPTQDNAVSNSLAIYYSLGPILGFIGAKEMARFRSFLSPAALCRMFLKSGSDPWRFRYCSRWQWRWRTSQCSWRISAT